MAPEPKALPATVMSVLCFSEFCSQILNSSVKPGFPKAIETNDPGVRRAARHSAEKFNNCSNDVFLFRESRISRALVQVRVGDSWGPGS